MKKSPVYFVSLGCPKNLVDSQVMLGKLENDRYEIAKEPDQAEVIIVNTCSFIQAAKEESIETILEMSQFKEEGNCKALVVSGCLPQRYAKELEKEKSNVKIEEEELASKLNTHQHFQLQDNSNNNENNDFDAITADEALEVKKQSLTNAAPTSLVQALVVFFLTEEFPTVILTITIQMCYNFLCLREYSSAFGLAENTNLWKMEYESRNVECILDLLQSDVSGISSTLSSFLAFA